MTPIPPARVMDAAHPLRIGRPAATVIAILAERRGRIATHEEIVSAWRWWGQIAPQKDTYKKAVTAARKAIKALAWDAEIVSYYDIGYMLTGDVSRIVEAAKAAAAQERALAEQIKHM